MNKPLTIIVLAVLVLVSVSVGVFALSRNKGANPISRTEAGISPSVAPSVSGSSPAAATRDVVAATAEVKNLTLTVTGPADGATVTSSPIVVKGKTSPYADVFVNDSETKADASGNFAAAVVIDEGENPIIVVVSDENGVTAEKDLTVNLVLPQ